LIIGKVI